MRETADSSLRATERPLRIVFVAGALSGGGAERQLLQLATALHQLNHQVTVATIAPTDVATDFRQVELWNGRRRTKVGTLWGLTNALFKLHSLCAKEQPDVVVGWLSIPIILAALASRHCRIPFVAALRNSRPEMLFATQWRSAQYALLRRNLNTASLVVANSQTGIDGYTKLGLVSKGRTCVIRNGVNASEFQPTRTEGTNTARAALGIAHPGPIALYVGRIAEEKDIPLLIHVVTASLNCRHDLQWLIVGLAPEKFWAIASQLNVNILKERVRCIPLLQKMALAYNASTFLCLTSNREGSPNCVLEARACGIPVISTDCGDVREYACSYDRIVAADPESFTNAINETLAEETASPQGTSMLSIGGCAEQWLTALRSVIRCGSKYAPDRIEA
jgi:glycosyltransferase involved in cell wall biosynthesis